VISAPGIRGRPGIVDAGFLSNEQSVKVSVGGEMSATVQQR
jgi:hypothetical protein